tara:strand:+ start:623 stop:760 length:138 start_codon:yes stop_codon:yes gene_type:complete
LDLGVGWDEVEEVEEVEEVAAFLDTGKMLEFGDRPLFIFSNRQEV